jgi:hypothetical protein
MRGIAPVAQLDRASGFEPEGREFESLRARHVYWPFAEPLDDPSPIRSAKCEFDAA